MVRRATTEDVGITVPRAVAEVGRDAAGATSAGSLAIGSASVRRAKGASMLWLVRMVRQKTGRRSTELHTIYTPDWVG